MDKQSIERAALEVAANVMGLEGGEAFIEATPEEIISICARFLDRIDAERGKDFVMDNGMVERAAKDAGIDLRHHYDETGLTIADLSKFISRIDAERGKDAKLPASFISFDDFLNEPQRADEPMQVREYRHQAYREWLKVIAAHKAAVFPTIPEGMALVKQSAVEYLQKYKPVLCERGGHNEPDRAKAVMCVDQAVNAWKNAAYARAEEVMMLQAKLAEIERALETERMRLAACGVVALSNNPDSAKRARQMLPEYRSASCDDVASLADSEMHYRTLCAEQSAGLERSLSVAINSGIDRIAEQAALIEQCEKAQVRALAKLAAYVGVCNGDKELTGLVLPLLRESLAAIATHKKAAE